MNNPRKAIWLSGCYFMVLICGSCGMGTPGSTNEEKSDIEKEQEKKGNEGKSGLVNNVVKKCGDLRENQCTATLGCKWESSKCADNKSLLQEECGDKNSGDCYDDPKCNYSVYLDKCFDNNKTKNGFQVYVKNCSDIEKYKDAEKICKETVGCAYRQKNKKCEEDKTLVSTGDCKDKNMANCLERSKCTWAEVLKKCVNQHVVSGTGCTDLGKGSCDSDPGCIWGAPDPDGPPGALMCANQYGATPPCNSHNDMTMCKGDYGCEWSGARNLCYNRPSAQTGLSTCFYVPADVCDSFFGCKLDHGLCGDYNDHGMASNRPCNAYHNNKIACWRQAGCVYSKIALRAGGGHPVYGGCFDAP